MAISAWLAKVSTSRICLVVKGRTLFWASVMTPIARMLAKPA